MERNRRIGKAYARVPIVTIDGSHELSYDGYKLALNGFDNPDRDLRTEECRKRIGKGIRIKMDNFGNILIKRLSKSGVYIKEWIQAPASLPSSSSSRGAGAGATKVAPGTTAGASSKATPGGKSATNQRVMPSRQQLIKNQNAMMQTANSSGSSTDSSLGSSQSTASSMDQQPASGGGGGGSGSSMTTNDSAICDEVLSVGGRLDQDKIYVLFDMKKFQANITQELCRPFPDKRKLEQQCFSIVGLARDSSDILNLPCWVMVINIVAIEVLNERFPDLMMSSASVAAAAAAGYSDATATRTRPPNFVSIFDRANGKESRRLAAKEEDPYSLPANESSSEMKSSIHGGGGDYAGRSRYYGGGGGNHGGAAPPKSRADMYKRGQVINDPKQQQQHYGTGQQLMAAGATDHAGPPAPMRYKSRSNSNIYGVGKVQQNPNMIRNHHNQQQQVHEGSRYSSSIYSPGHMLVLPSNDSVPPELPPRDFVAGKKVTKSKSSTAISKAAIARDNNHRQPSAAAAGAEEIYSTGGESSINPKARKTKRNRFLESLKAPLELAKSSSSRSCASGLASSAQNASINTAAAAADKTKNSSQTVASGGKSIGASKSNIVKSLLGVGSKSKQQQQHQHEDKVAARPTKDQQRESGEADSVVDSSGELADEPLSQASSSSYNDLDIPTPDYETDENIYALNNCETSSYAAFSSIVAGDSSNNNNKTTTEKAAKKSSTTKQNIAASQLSANNNNNNSGGGNGNGNGKTSNGQQPQKKNNNNSKQNNGSKAHNKDDLYYSGFRAHVPSNINHAPPQQQQQPVRSNGKAASLVDGGVDGNGRLMRTRTSRYASHLAAGGAKMLASKASGRDMMIYGSTTQLSAASVAGGGVSGSRYRSASMQRCYSRQPLLGQQPQPMYSDYYCDLRPAELDLYGGGHYGVALGGGGGAQGRRRSNSKCLPNNSANIYGVAGGGQTTNYDIGRSSSGIYGANSNSSSSSDYADWHPQMRKVNSSGYLNSIFKNHHHHYAAALDSPYGAGAVGHEQQAHVAPKQLKTKPTAHSSSSSNNNSSSASSAESRAFVASRTLGPSRSASVLSKQQQLQSHGQILLNGGPAYRSYDSSNGKLLCE